MITDTVYLDADERLAARKNIEGYLSGQRTIDLPSEAYSTLAFAGLNAAAAAADAAAAKATKDRIPKQMEMLMTVALARDMKYAHAGRKAMLALAYHSAMFRCYRPACALLKVSTE